MSYDACPPASRPFAVRGPSISSNIAIYFSRAFWGTNSAEQQQASKHSTNSGPQDAVRDLQGTAGPALGLRNVQETVLLFQGLPET